MLRFLLSFFVVMCSHVGSAQTLVPTAEPVMLVVGEDGTTTEETSHEGSAPLRVRWEARPKHLDGQTARYEWRFVKSGETEPFLVRYDENTEFEFLESGTFSIKLLATFGKGDETIDFEMDAPFAIVVSESKLEVPNAFTPNGDGINDVFRVKEGHRSLVQFRAIVVNRWGKKVAEWSDPNEGWDGRVGGTDAPDGAYYLRITARGADGRNYNIKKTINLLRKYEENAAGGTGG